MSVAAEPVPLELDETGTYRVGRTRMPLDTVVFAFNNGWTPEEIVQAYSALALSDVYAVIAYYLRHREQIDEYLAKRERQADELQREIDARFPDPDLRARLEARLAFVAV